MTNYPLRKFNTFGLDVYADNFLEYHSEEELLTLIHEGRITDTYLHIGRGSNLLFRGNYAGTILHSCIGGITVVSENENEVDLCVGAGVLWDALVRYCVEHNWYGVENLSLIPGETGAAAVQNIGAYGVEVKDVITSVQTVDITGRRRIYQADECAYSYRHSLFKEPWMKSVFVTYVNFRLHKTPCFVLNYAALRDALTGRSIDLHTVRDAVISLRRNKLPDPDVLGNAGSFFMNPVVPRGYWEKLKQVYPDIPHYDVNIMQVKIPAGWLIEQCGWKGKSLGAAAVYDKQALVLVNLGTATGQDIVMLAETVQKAVKEKFGIQLQPEVLWV